MNEVDFLASNKAVDFVALNEHLKEVQPIFDAFCARHGFVYVPRQAIGRYPRIRPYSLSVGAEFPEPEAGILPGDLFTSGGFGKRSPGSACSVATIRRYCWAAQSGAATGTGGRRDPRVLRLGVARRQ